MKRIAALFLAVLSLAGCSSKKSSEAPAPDEDGDAAVEEPVKEYTKDEFRRIDVPLQVEQRDTGIQLEELDLTSMDFGEQLPPCKKLDDPYIYRRDWDADDEYLAAFEESLTTPAKGRPISAQLDEDDIYIYVSYDPICMWMHSFGIYRYSIADGSLSEFFIPEGTGDTSLEISDYQIVDGRLFRAEHSDSRVMEIDPATGSEEVFYQNSSLSYYYISAGEHCLHVIDLESDESGDHVIDINTGEEVQLREFYNGNLLSDPEGVWHTEITPGTEKELDIVTDDFRISTGLRNFTGAFVNGSKLSVLVTLGNLSYNELRLYTYDMDKMELYVTDVTPLGYLYMIDGSLLFINESQGMFSMSHYVPEIGTAFRVADLNDVTFAGLGFDNRMFAGKDEEGYISRLLWLPDVPESDE